MRNLIHAIHLVVAVLFGVSVGINLAREVRRLVAAERKEQATSPEPSAEDLLRELRGER